MIAKYYQLLKDFLSFKSSIDIEDDGKELKKASKWLKKIFEENKLNSEIIEGYGNPIIYAEHENNKSLPTCLIYGNYDIIETKKESTWKNDPFSLFIGKEKIYGRGTANNKGQILIHMISIFELIKEKNLGYNIKFIIDGEKTIGSPNTIKFIENNKEKLKSDLFLNSDGTLINEKPCIGISTRGNIELLLEIQSADNNLDLETYGGIIPNAIQEMSKLLSKLYGGNQQINIPYFYYEVEDIPFNNILNNKKIDYDRDNFKKENGIGEIFKDKNNDYFSQIGMKPTVQITSISLGDNSIANESIIPKSAKAELTFKIVKKQDPDKIIKSFQQRVISNIPDYLKYNISIKNKSIWTQIDTNNKYYEKVKNLAENIYKKELLQQNMGISIPILDIIQKEITNNIIIFPLANNDCNYKGINENLNIENIEKGILFSLNLFSKQTQLF